MGLKNYLISVPQDHSLILKTTVKTAVICAEPVYNALKLCTHTLVIKSVAKMIMSESIIIQKKLLLSVFFICYYRVKIYIFDAFEDIGFHGWIHLF